MCLGIPGKVVEIRDDGALRMARVDFGGVRKEACLAYLPEVVIGDYVIVHVGFAISQLDEEEALKTLDLLLDFLAVRQERGHNDDRTQARRNTLTKRETRQRPRAKAIRNPMIHERHCHIRYRDKREEREEEQLVSGCPGLGDTQKWKCKDQAADKRKCTKVPPHARTCGSPIEPGSERNME